MADSEPEVELTTVECCQCGKVVEVRATTIWGEWFTCQDLPPGWLVTDTYPPGDDGLRFACSIQCAKGFVDEHMYH